MSREDYVKSLGTTCHWRVEDDMDGHPCGRPAPFTSADGPPGAEWGFICAFHACIESAADLHGEDRVRVLEELHEQWRNIDARVQP